jgi:AraC family transcriptional regulator
LAAYHHPATDVTSYDTALFSSLRPTETLVPSHRGIGVLTQFGAPDEYEVLVPAKDYAVILMYLGDDHGPTYFTLGDRRDRRTHRKGEIVVVPPCVGSQWAYPAGHPAVLHAHLPMTRFAQLADDEGVNLSGMQLLADAGSDGGRLGGLMAKLLDEHARRQFGHRAMTDLIAQELTLELVRSHSNLRLASPPERPRVLIGRRLTSVKDLVEAHLGDDIGLTEMAAAAGLSTFHFTREFKRVTGLTPVRYLTHRRIARAKTLLERTSRPLADVALACGFASQSSFTTAFARETGTTPGRWRATCSASDAR